MNKIKNALVAIAIISAGLLAFKPHKITFDDIYYKNSSGVFVSESGTEGINFDCPTRVTDTCLYYAIVASPSPTNANDYRALPGYQDKRHRQLP